MQNDYTLPEVKTITLEPKIYKNEIRIDTKWLNYKHEYHDYSQRVLLKTLEANILSKVHDKIVYTTPLSWIDHLFLTLNNRYKFLKLPVKYKTEKVVIEDLYLNIPFQNQMPVRISYIESFPPYPLSYYE